MWNGCFWAVVLEKALLSPLDCKRSNQSILKEISPEYSLEGLRLKLKCQYFGHLMWRTDSLEKTLMLGKIEGRRRRGRRRMRWLDGITWLDGHEFEQALGVGDGQEILACCSAWGHRVRHDWVTELNWTEYFDAYYVPDSRDLHILIAFILITTLWGGHNLLFPFYRQ